MSWYECQTSLQRNLPSSFSDSPKGTRSLSGEGLRDYTAHNMVAHLMQTKASCHWQNQQNAVWFHGVHREFGMPKDPLLATNGVFNWLILSQQERCCHITGHIYLCTSTQGNTCLGWQHRCQCQLATHGEHSILSKVPLFEFIYSIILNHFFQMSNLKDAFHDNSLMFQLDQFNFQTS